PSTPPPFPTRRSSDLMVAEFKRRRDILVDGLNKLPGVKCLRPRGAFYVFPNITGTRRSSAEVAERLLNEAGVAALSCAAFGAHGDRKSTRLNSSHQII